MKSTLDLIISLLGGLFDLGYKVVQILDTDTPQSKEEYQAWLREQLNVPTAGEIEEAKGILPQSIDTMK